MTENAKSILILCADDYGISPGVNRAIVDLAAQGRLSAVSCMSLGSAWDEGAKELKPLAGKIAVGLHVTLTYLPALTTGRSQPCEKEVIMRSWLRLLDRGFIEREIRAQFEKFIAVWGAPPDFIDGHQHVHILPAVRDVVLALRAEYASRAWVRNVVDVSSLGGGLKNALFVVLGWRLRQKLAREGIAHNRFLRGAYNYDRPADFAALMTRWCAAASAPVLVYCHPGFPDEALARVDRVLEPRRREYDFFNGAQFGAWLGGTVALTVRP